MRIFLSRKRKPRGVRVSNRWDDGKEVGAMHLEDGGRDHELNHASSLWIEWTN